MSAGEDTAAIASALEAERYGPDFLRQLAVEEVPRSRCGAEDVPIARRRRAVAETPGAGRPGHRPDRS